MKQVVLLVFSFFSFAMFGFAQHHEQNDPGKNNLLHYFKHGHMSGQVRSFTMASTNADNLNDYNASSIGASIHFETLPIKGFSAGFNGLFVYRVFSNSLNANDPRVNQGSAYEIQLFDVEHRGNYTDLDRLEELYIKYQSNKLKIMFGKMEMHSPMVNPHDGRMKPKVFSGGKIQYTFKELSLHGAYFTKASPRSTTHWYSINDAIGIYNNGYLPDGTHAHYHGSLQSSGLGIVGVESNKKRKLQIKVWEYYLDNISNTSLVQLEHHSDSSFFGGLMYLNQRAINNGGSIDQEFAFYNSSCQTDAFSARIGMHFKPFTVQINATRILDSGKFLFPREFGVDPFYTFISRSQIEGYGDATSTGISLFKTIKKTNIRLD